MGGKKYFRIDARAMLTWGRESIKDHTTAVLELVKNSYDAGSDVVEVEVSAAGSNRKSHFIRISDAGEGMGESDVDQYWLRIGYSIKREKPKTSGGRRKTGEKGIGRISADRLGSYLELRTQRSGAKPYGLAVNWADFETPGRELDKVPMSSLEGVEFRIPRPAKFDSLREEYKSAPQPETNSQRRSGTELIIRGIRDHWTAADIDDLRRALSVLTPPFGDVSDFQIRLLNDVKPESSGVVTSPFYTTAEVEGSFRITKSGRVTCTFVTRDSRGARRKRAPIKLAWKELTQPIRMDVVAGRRESPTFGAASATLLFYPRVSKTLRGSELVLGELREFLDQNAGIKVYRDKIRVMPYGDPLKPEGDWLGLGARKATDPAGAARARFRVSPNQLVGAVYLTRDGNPSIADTSGREGLIHGDAFFEFQAFLLGCLFQLEACYHSVFKERLREPEIAVSPRKAVGKLNAELKELSQSLGSLKGELPRRASLRAERAVELLGHAQERLRDTSKSIEDLANQATVYRGLATLGIAAGTFGHETLGAIEGMSVSVKGAMRVLEKNPSHVESVLEELEKSLMYGERVSAWGRFTLGRVRRDKRTRRKTDVRKLVDELLDELDAPFEGASVRIRRDLRSAEGRVFPMDIESVLLNLLTNAYHFVRLPKRKREVRVRLRSKTIDGAPGVQIQVDDSGHGVPAKNKEAIWEPLFTTKVDARNRVFGTGLGLSIVDSVVEDLGGIRDVMRSQQLRGACFTVWLPFG